MIRKKHSIKNTVKVSKINENKNYIEISYIGAYFLGAIFLIMTFISGYFLGKIKNIDQTSSATVQQAQPQDQQQAQPQAQPKISMDTIKSLFAKNVIKFGNGDKKLLMVEVSDPSCPFCHVAGGANKDIGNQMGPQFKLVSEGGSYVAPVMEMKKLIDTGKADFVWIYKNGHGSGEMAAKALYCAFDQGKFWQVHDLLMSARGYDLINNQIKNDTSKSQQLANFLASSADKNKLKSCLDSGKYNSRLQEDSNLANSLGVNGTPGFYLNTTNFAGAYNWNDMKSAAEAALQK